MRTFDFDAARAARQEAEDERPVVVIGGTKYELPAAPPLLSIIGLGRCQAGDLLGLRDVIVALFGRDHVDPVLEAGFDLVDFEALFMDVYGMDVGEPLASGG